MRVPVGFTTWVSIGSTLLWVALLACADEDSSPRGERYQRVGTDIVREASTGLEWLAHDDGREIDWHAADRFCRNLSRAGRSQWRPDGPR